MHLGCKIQSSRHRLADPQLPHFIYFVYQFAFPILCTRQLYSCSLFCFLSGFRFRIDNTDHIIDVNKGNIPFEYDQVNIICPVYTPGTHEEDAEKYIIYNVSIFLHIFLSYSSLEENFDTFLSTSFSCRSQNLSCNIIIWRICQPTARYRLSLKHAM